jgi:Family of unknown function (DUF6090)
MEHEIQGHAKKVYKVWNNPKKSIWEKIKDIAIEVGIIVFAITVSIWFHNMSEKGHKKEEVNVFLAGLKKDISDDIAQCKNCLAFFHNRDTFFNTVINNPSSINEIVVKDSTTLVNKLFTNVWLVPTDSRYEGFKFSGKMENIENDSLKYQILSYYQAYISRLKFSENSWRSNQSKLLTYWGENIIENEKGGDNGLEILKNHQARYLCKQLMPYTQLFDRYQAVIEQGKSIIKQIEDIGIK